MKILKPEIAVADSRGILKEVVKNFTWKQMNHFITKKGSVRGQHYHKYNLELYYLLKGKLSVHITDVETKNESRFLFEKGSCFIIEPYEYHTLRYLTNVEYIILLSEEFNSKNPDIYKL